MFVSPKGMGTAEDVTWSKVVTRLGGSVERREEPSSHIGVLWPAIHNLLSIFCLQITSRASSVTVRSFKRRSKTHTVPARGY